MTVPSSSFKDILNNKNVEQIRYNQEVTTAQAQQLEENDTPAAQEESAQENDPNTHRENSDNNTSNNDSASENKENPTQFTVWVNPEASGSQSTLSSEAIKSVSNNGTLAVSIDSSISYVNELQLSANQVGQIIERNIHLLITKGDNGKSIHHNFPKQLSKFLQTILGCSLYLIKKLFKKVKE